MQFFRNQEVRQFCVLLTLATLILSALGCLYALAAGLLILLACLLLSAVSLLFTAWRYRQIQKLAGYLKRITDGEYTLDIRDNEEGELSILKSELYKVTARLSEYNERLRQEKIRLSDSLADISHQLKTPLTSMMVMADLLQDSGLPEKKRKEFTGRIHTQLERIQWLVSSLLKLSKLDAGVAEMRPETISVSALLERASSPLLIPIELKELALKMEGPKEAFLIADARWTEEALVNILKNCVEHTPAGGLLHIKWTDNPLYTEIRIADNGEGIAPEDVPHIFTRFYKGKNAAPESVGIGLAMAKSILLRQNGDITVESRPGKGTVFQLRFYKTVI